ncbi:MAG: hypothetical protein CFH01_01254 [Alphaproteobacteria bacterium MarineAlpha2_Bin1]|nr:MAG: hypothetical protein CFH01_01254 [Alphaproteobacteria bacterium MarineAlpha2_Bin1]
MIMKSFQFIFILVFLLFVFYDYLNSPNLEHKQDSKLDKSSNCAPCGAPCELIKK